MEPQSDASDTRGDPLVARWRADPAGGFAEIVDRYGPMVHARCRRVLGDRDADADDAAQAVFLVLHRRRDRALAAPVLAAWLMATTTLVLRNAVRDRDRRRSREAPMSDRPAPDPVDGAPDPRIRDRLDACLDRLPDPERTALILHYLGGHSIAEVAARTGAGISTVTDRLRRGLARLRRALGGPDGPVGLGAVTVGMAADGALPPALAARLHALPTTPPPPGPDRWAHLETISVTRIALVASAGLVLGGGILLVLPTAEPPAPPAADPVAAAVPAGPAVYRSGTGAAMRYLVMDQGLAMVQDLNGTVIASERLQADGGDRWTGRRWGIAGTLALRREGAAVLLTDGSGTARFERVAGSLAPAVGWDAHPVAAGPAPAALRDRLVQELSRITAARSKAQAAFQAALRRRSGDTPVTALP
ncbi:MAG: polymerase sigma factor SigE, partial [Planctomycetota bacterium]